MEKRQARVFTNMNKAKQFAWCMVVLSLLASCNDTGLNGGDIPYIPFADREINLLRSPEGTDLSNQGFALVDEGVRGIILYRQGTNYLAYERNCSFQPRDSCATVNVDASLAFMIDPCCNSQFNFSDGFPTGGPATNPLRRYRTFVAGNILTITSEPDN